MEDPRITIRDALPREMTRVRDQVMPPYIEAGRGGSFVLTRIRADLDRAAKALAEQDMSAMFNVLHALQQYRV